MIARSAVDPEPFDPSAEHPFQQLHGAARMHAEITHQILLRFSLPVAMPAGVDDQAIVALLSALVEETGRACGADLIRQGYDFSFMTNTAPITKKTDPRQIQRTNIEAEFSLPLVRFQLSGLVDLMYAGKRKRVNRLTGNDE